MVHLRLRQEIKGTDENEEENRLRHPHIRILGIPEGKVRGKTNKGDEVRGQRSGCLRSVDSGMISMGKPS